MCSFDFLQGNSRFGRRLTVLFVRPVWTVHLSVAELAAHDTFGAVEAGLFPRRAAWERRTGGSIETPAAFTGTTARIRQAQMDASAVVFGAAIGSLKKWERGLTN